MLPAHCFADSSASRCGDCCNDCCCEAPWACPVCNDCCSQVLVFREPPRVEFAAAASTGLQLTANVMSGMLGILVEMWFDIIKTLQPGVVQRISRLGTLESTKPRGPGITFSSLRVEDAVSNESRLLFPKSLVSAAVQVSLKRNNRGVKA